MKSASNRSVLTLTNCVILLVLCAVHGRLTQAASDAHDVRIAVGANFAQTADRLCQAFFSERPGRCVLTPGASGLLASQVAQGAPFDLFLSADRRRAERLEVDGLAVPGTRFTYAIGRLVLWAPAHGSDEDLKAVLSGSSVRTLAIANPDSAPYGAAAIETLRSLGMDPAGPPRIVRGENVAQTFQFIASGAADAGFVALSQVLEYQASSGKNIEQQVVNVDPTLHAPIEQQAVLLKQAAGNDDARDLLEFLRSDSAGRIIGEAGYALPAR